MRVLYILVPISALMFLAGWFSYGIVYKKEPTEVLNATTEVVVKSLEKYSIEKMKNAEWKNGTFTIEEELGNEEEYTSYLFSFEFYPEIEGGKKKKTTGQINIPKSEGPFPIILMFRGFVDQTLYTTGTGTRPAASYFAKNGYITIAPDFLGYADSDSESGNIFETRFQTYVTAISLLKTIEKFKTDNNSPKVNPNLDEFTQSLNSLITFPKLFIWGHSNGGHIALTTLVVTGAQYPTTLWAPASKSFPYVILYFTDEAEDGGKFIRKELAEFEEIYDVNKFTYSNYLSAIQAPIQLHQGSSDAAVPIAWSNDLVGRLRQEKKHITYFIYSGADHNLRLSWDEVVEKDAEFFEKHQ